MASLVLDSLTVNRVHEEFREFTIGALEFRAIENFTIDEIVEAVTLDVRDNLVDLGEDHSLLENVLEEAVIESVLLLITARAYELLGGNYLAITAKMKVVRGQICILDFIVLNAERC